MTWICLELPEIPVEHRGAAATRSAGVVAIECNSGAERAVILAAPGWDDEMSDVALSDAIVDVLGGSVGGP